MFFCPFCGTLLLVRPCSDTATNGLCCSTCRYVERIPRTTGTPLTVTHSFASCNKTIPEDVDDEQHKQRSARAAGATAGSASVSSSPYVAGGSANEEEAADQIGSSEGAEGGQIITVACQNEQSACNSNKAFFVQIQMRSADEPATTFYKCVKCGFQWRQD